MTTLQTDGRGGVKGLAERSEQRCKPQTFWLVLQNHHNHHQQNSIQNHHHHYQNLNHHPQNQNYPNQKHQLCCWPTQETPTLSEGPSPTGGHFCPHRNCKIEFSTMIINVVFRPTGKTPTLTHWRQRQRSWPWVQHALL